MATNKTFAETSSLEERLRGIKKDTGDRDMLLISILADEQIDFYEKLFFINKLEDINKGDYLSFLFEEMHPGEIIKELIKPEIAKTAQKYQNNLDYGILFGDTRAHLYTDYMFEIKENEDQFWGQVLDVAKLVVKDKYDNGLDNFFKIIYSLNESYHKTLFQGKPTIQHISSSEAEHIVNLSDLVMGDEGRSGFRSNQFNSVQELVRLASQFFSAKSVVKKNTSLYSLLSAVSNNTLTPIIMNFESNSAQSPENRMKPLYATARIKSLSHSREKIILASLFLAGFYGKGTYKTVFQNFPEYALQIYNSYEIHPNNPQFKSLGLQRFSEVFCEATSCKKTDLIQGDYFDWSRVKAEWSKISDVQKSELWAILSSQFRKDILDKMSDKKLLKIPQDFLKYNTLNDIKLSVDDWYGLTLGYNGVHKKTHYLEQAYNEFCSTLTPVGKFEGAMVLDTTIPSEWTSFQRGDKKYDAGHGQITISGVSNSRVIKRKNRRDVTDIVTVEFHTKNIWDLIGDEVVPKVAHHNFQSDRKKRLFTWLGISAKQTEQPEEYDPFVSILGANTQTAGGSGIISALKTSFFYKYQMTHVKSLYEKLGEANTPYRTTIPNWLLNN